MVAWRIELTIVRLRRDRKTLMAEIRILNKVSRLALSWDKSCTDPCRRYSSRRTRALSTLVWRWRTDRDHIFMVRQL